MPASPATRDPITLFLPQDVQWTLHHVLLHHIQQEQATHNTETADSLTSEILEAFEILDEGNTQFSVQQLQAILNVLAEYHHKTNWWEIERQQLERLLHRVVTALEKNQPQQLH